MPLSAEDRTGKGLLLDPGDRELVGDTGTMF